MKTINLTHFVNDYLLTASWVTCERGENTNFTKEAKQTAKQDCETFIKNVLLKFGEEKGTELLTIAGNDLYYLAPHDFYLTRNRHGAGFWDKETIYGFEESEILTQISQEFKESNAYHTGGKKSKLTLE